MGFIYSHLDEVNRQKMFEEIEYDEAREALYVSSRLNPRGKRDYADVLRDAVQSGDERSLAVAIRPLLNSHDVPRRLKNGGWSKPPKMRSDAHQVLAEGEFNRFYIRAMCALELKRGGASVEVVRAKEVRKPRPESEMKLGQLVEAASLLDDLRRNPGVDTALGLPAGPGSGLSVARPKR